MAADDTPLSRLRAVCLNLPEAEERETWDAPTFRVRDKIFAMVHPVRAAAGTAPAGASRPSVWCKAPPGAQTVLTEAAPDRFFIPPYVGHKGWIGLWLDVELDWEETAALIERSWRMTAPKRLVATLVSSSGDTPDAPSPRRSPPSHRPSSRRKSASGR